MSIYFNIKLNRLRVLFFILMLPGLWQLSAQEQVSSTVSSGGGFSSGEGYSNFSVVGGGPFYLAMESEPYSGSIGFLYNTSNPFIGADTVTVNYLAGENGTIGGDTLQRIIIGSDGTSVEALADSCYVFVEWSDGVTDNPRTDQGVTSEFEVTAIFAEVEINTAISVDSSFTLHANQEGAIYQWFDCTNGVAIDSATSQSFTPSDTSGTYSVMIITDNCEVMSNCVSPTSVGFENRFTESFEFGVYPNPARDYFRITSNRSGNITLVNSQGQKIQTFMLDSMHGYEFNVQGMQPGLYFIIGDFDDQRITKRVIVAE